MDPEVHLADSILAIVQEEGFKTYLKIYLNDKNQRHSNKRAIITC